MVRRILRTLILACFLLLCGATSQALGCSCMLPGPPCQEYWNSDVIFAGVPLSFTKTEIADNDRKRTLRIFHFRSDEAFRGVKVGEIEIWTGLGGGDCGYDFEIGTKYLVYAHIDPATQRIYAAICSRTQTFAKATEDLSFIRSLSNAQPGGLIYGALIVRRPSLGTGGGFVDNKPVSGVPVVISSPTLRLETLTDDEGKYSFSGLPPGKYNVHVALPDNLSPRPDETLAVLDRGCAEGYHFTTIDTRISGKLIDSQGRTSGTKSISLVPVMPNGKYGVPTDNITTPEGNFEFTDLAPGQYLIAVNMERAPSEELPYKRTFYVSGNSADPHSFTIEEGQKITGIEFRLPPPLAERQITGVVVYADGKPAAGANVILRDALTSWQVGPIAADPTGHFTAKVYDGVTYKVEAMMPVDPNWKRESGKPQEYLISRSTQVTASEYPEEIRLVVDKAPATRGRRN